MENMHTDVKVERVKLRSDKGKFSEIPQNYYRRFCHVFISTNF